MDEPTIFVCRTCGYAGGELNLCPSCEEPLMEWTPELQEEFQRNRVLQSLVGMMQGRRWY